MYVQGNRAGVDCSVISDDTQQSYVGETRAKKRRDIEVVVTIAGYKGGDTVM